MSNRRRLAQPIALALRALDGGRIPGGCEHCDAYQTAQVDRWGRDIHHLTVHHDNWCPWYAARRTT